MGGGTRPELASGSAESCTLPAAYSTGQRGSYQGPIMERSTSFRESLDSRVLSAGSGASRSPSISTPPIEVALLEPPCFPDQKHTRLAELRRIFGSPQDAHSSSSFQSKSLLYEDFKHIKALAIDARERAKQFQECIVKVERCRNIQSRKRQRNENASFEKSSGSSLLKMGGQGPLNLPDISLRVDDRTKISVPNRRVRSSVAEQRSEGRTNMLPRQNSTIDKDRNVTDKEKNLLRPCGGGSNPVEDKNRGLSASGDGWEKNMKRKRSMGPLAARAMDADREHKQSTQQRVSSESHPRNNDGLGFRPGSLNGANGFNKLDGSSQATGNCTRVPQKIDLETSPADRRERAMLDKERTVTKENIKQTVRDDSQLGSQIPSVKGKSSRAPRSNPGSIMNSSPHFSKILGGHDGWEQTSNLSKLQQSGAPNNRKRPLPIGPSSPPVTQWVGQRTQKSSRTRRTNLISPVSTHDESPLLSEGFSSPDTGAKLSISDPIAPGTSRTTSTCSQQSKLKSENALSPALFSESEESGGIDNKTLEKGTDNMEEENMNMFEKVPSVVLPTKKIKNPKEVSSDGVRRQGRSGRVSLQLKSSINLKEKLEPIEPVKQLQTGRPGTDRNDSKVGRPPSKKASDRKAFVRPGNTVNNNSPQQTGDFEDDQDDLLAAATFVRDSCYMCRSQFTSGRNNAEPFWDKIKPYFTFISPNDRDLIKQQIKFSEELGGSLNVDVDDELTRHGTTEAHVSGQRKASENSLRWNRPFETFHHVNEMHSGDATLGSDRWFERLVPLSQRLLAAIIPEDEFEIPGCNANELTFFTQLSGGYLFETSCNASSEIKESGSRMELDNEMEWVSQNQRNSSCANISCNGHITSSMCRSSDANNHSYNSGSTTETSIQPCSEIALPSNYMHASLDGMHISDLCVSNPSMSDCQYEDMSLDDKILLELQSIGLCPEPVPDLTEGEDDEIDKDICKLKLKLYGQVRTKKNPLCKVDEAVQNSTGSEERFLEQLAMNKLIGSAYGKLQGLRGGTGSNKGAKIPKQAALAFAKRTLARCRKFELTGKSCFSEAHFQHVLFTPPMDTSEPAIAAYYERQFCHHESHSSGSNKGKRKELPLDDVIGSASTGVAPFGSTLAGGAKGRRTDYEQNRDTHAKMAKAGRPSVGERKTKAKLKQKTAQLSSSGNILGRPLDTHSAMSAAVKSCVAVNGAIEEGLVGSLPTSSTHQELSIVEETIDFCSLPLHDVLGGQGQDIASWLNVDEEALQDNDLLGLEIPMDDLSDLNMNF